MTETEVLQAIARELGQPIVKIKWFNKGYVSAAALVQPENGHSVVAKLGINPIGYINDRYAHEHFSSTDLPIPKVKRIARLKKDAWLCISEYIEGINGDSLSGEAALPAVENVQKTMANLHSTNVDGIIGYGHFDANAWAFYSSWSQFLTDDFFPEEFYADPAIDTELITNARSKIANLATFCPEKRFLAHGDLGSSNLIIKNNAVVAVLDWQTMLIGDWAFDIAQCQKNYCDIYGDLKSAYRSAGFDCTNWDERINCYQLRHYLDSIFWVWQRHSWGLKSDSGVKDIQQELKVRLAQIEKTKL
jgi:hygromycin-B 4-O-kinase